MTDNEIIKALECCSTDIRESTCPMCAFYKKHRCSTLMLNAASDLINRQKAQIERLEYVRKGDEQLINSLNKCYKNAKTEAIKEFAEKLKEYELSMFCSFPNKRNLGSEQYIVLSDCIDYLVKDMTEAEENGYNNELLLSLGRE